MRLRILLLLVATLAVPTGARASAVAVMRFRDLSGGTGSIGEAIRETVTTDLKGISGMTLVERARLDKVLVELQAQNAGQDLDPLTAVKVGKLCGATLIVTGAYQKSANDIRITARFVSVETGEVVGTAKVDGAQGDFLRLQDKITAQLLKSAGVDGTQVQRFAARPRPKVRSIRTIELYGDSVIEPDDQKRKQLLVEAVKTDPDFVYASRDLEALEGRLQRYAAKSQEANDQATKAELAKIETQIAAEKDPGRIYVFYVGLLGRLVSERRYHTLIALCHRLRATPPIKQMPPMYARSPSLEEEAQKWLVDAYKSLKDDDNLLREGEIFLKKYPTSMSFAMVQTEMDVAIERKRQQEEGVALVEREFAGWPPAKRANPCETGPIYHSQRQFKNARAALELCAKHPSPDKPWFPAYMLVLVDEELGDFAGAKRWLEVLRTQNPEKYRGMRDLETRIPRD